MKQRLIKNKSVTNYFMRHVISETVKYWIPFRYGSKKYIMTFEYNLYEINGVK